MEDAADALKIAFAVFVFVIAITLLFALTSQAKDTADYVLYYNDETNFHIPFPGGEREVSGSEVISTLYRYYKESICVTVNLNGEEAVPTDKIRSFDLSNRSYTNEAQIEQELGEYINRNLKAFTDYKFSEEFIEVPISGIYMTGEDGTQITLSAGGNKVYVTYTLID